MSAAPQTSDTRDGQTAIETPAVERLAGYVRTLGRGPGRSRALTRAEALDAFGIVLSGAADPHQIGALLMLMRFRGETAAEITGLVDAVHASANWGLSGRTPAIALDWASYGAGRTRGEPWFLLAALALAQSGRTILMHGSNEFSSGTSVVDALTALGRPVASSMAEALDLVDADGFAYLPLAKISPQLNRLLQLRKLLGLRSPVNTAARLLNPFKAPASIAGVFHPPYLDLHVKTAEELGFSRLLALKGAGGEAERNPLKPLRAHLHDRATGPRSIEFPEIASASTSAGDGASDLATVWKWGNSGGPRMATIVGTIALGLVALGETEEPSLAYTRAEEIWAARHDRQR